MRYLTAVVPVVLDVPVRMGVTRIVLLITADLDLLEPPLWKDGVCRTEVAAENMVTEAQTGRERMDPLHLIFLAHLDIINDLDDPVVMMITDGRVAIA